MEINKHPGTIFREVQRFGLLIRLSLILLMAVVAVVEAFVLKTIILSQTALPPTSTILLTIAGVVLPIAIATLLAIAKLETEVRSDGLCVRYFPFHIRYRKFVAEDLSECYACTYRPILEYGGWGIRYGFCKKGKVYNASGNKGVQLVFKNGKRLLIGSQNADELTEAIALITRNNQPQK